MRWASSLFTRPYLTLFYKNIIRLSKVKNMICDSCKIERLETDFILNQKYCFRCEYRKKLKKIAENRTCKIKKCRNCNKEIVRKENYKKRQRTIFCSLDCAKKGHRERMSNYWTRKISAGSFV